MSLRVMSLLDLGAPFPGDLAKRASHAKILKVRLMITVF